MKKYGIVVFGSTGFTGKLVCKHIIQAYHGQGDLKWAMAGRSREKLEKARAEVAPDPSMHSEIDLLEADTADQASLNALAASTSVLITTVGPYSRYGRPVVQACVENSTHYCDITGEAQFIRSSIDEFDAPAKEKGARIVHCCGFDSIPSEVVTLLAAHYMSTEHGKKLGQVASTVSENGGGSGATIESVIEHLQQVRNDSEVARVSKQPYSLTRHFRDPAALRELPDKQSPTLPMWSAPLRAWTGPFFMAVINEKVVRMSNSLLGWRYGKQMTYSERAGRGFVAAAMASFKALMIGLLFGAASRVAWVRNKLPQPGEGPSSHDGFFKVVCYALPDSGERDLCVTATMADHHRDPGYWSTSRMLLECAMCMLPSNAHLLAADPYASSCPSGVLAPSAALGLVLHERLRNSGYELHVGPSEKKKL